ncbi:MAG: monovalent cation/H(+) antiporter subunit G [Yoonia sp.]|uniref:cation:proton antiporter n=1 Tax=Yoonia sp. TaxID=2212373 RepID=UPI003265D0F9
MTLDLILTVGVAISLIIGLFFTFVAAIGLLKLDNSMSRLHAPTKAGTVGIGAFLMASMLNSFLIGQGSLHELLIMGFLFVTAPISANFMAKVNIHNQSCITPPPPPRDDTWATLNVPEADRELAETPVET